jgi:hypothetical protein
LEEKYEERIAKEESKKKLKMKLTLVVVKPSQFGEVSILMLISSFQM